MTLEALLNNPNALPNAPKVVAELISSFENEDVAVDEIARKLSTDPVLSAKLLRLANSAYYHVSFRIGTVDHALHMLGFVTVRTLVISSGLVSTFKSVPGIDLKRFWRYSLNTAVAAKWIAGKAGENGDLAFTVGMMHAIGLLVIHTGVPAAALEVSKIAGPFDPRRLQAEQAALGYTFAEVGAALAERWKFPPDFPESLTAFPDPLTGHGLGAVIHLAAWRAQAEENKLSDEELEATFPADAAETLGLDAELLLEDMPELTELSAGLEELVNG